MCIGRNSRKTVVSGLSQVCQKHVKEDRPEEKRSSALVGLHQRIFCGRPRARLSSVVKVSHEPPGLDSHSAEAGQADASAPCCVDVVGRLEIPPKTETDSRQTHKCLEILSP